MRVPGFTAAEDRAKRAAGAGAGEPQAKRQATGADAGSPSAARSAATSGGVWG